MPRNAPADDPREHHNETNENREEKQGFGLRIAHKIKIGKIHDRIGRVDTQKRNQNPMFPKHERNHNANQNEQNQKRHVSRQIAFDANVAKKIIEIHSVRLRVKIYDFNFFTFFAGSKKFFFVEIFCPVSFSSFFLASPAIFPPF